MLSKYRQKRQEGFTIIEVLIVLAIAGLILLVVFLAVPALQRNNRNTQRDNDVANLLAGVSEYINNNNGSLPASKSGTDSTVTFEGGQNSNSVTVNVGFYNGNTEVSLTDTVPASNNSTESNVVIIKGATCDGNNPASGPSRAFVAIYTKETGAQQCQAS